MFSYEAKQLYTREELATNLVVTDPVQRFEIRKKPQVFTNWVCNGFKIAALQCIVFGIIF